MVGRAPTILWLFVTFLSESSGTLKSTYKGVNGTQDGRGSDKLTRIKTRLSLTSTSVIPSLLERDISIACVLFTTRKGKDVAALLRSFFMVGELELVGFPVTKFEKSPKEGPSSTTPGVYYLGTFIRRWAQSCFVQHLAWSLQSEEVVVGGRIHLN